MPELEVSEDALLDGAVTLLQLRGGHRAGTDAVLLAASVAPRPGSVVVDLGAGAGAVGLMIAHAAPDAEIVLVERDPALVALCRENIRRNGLEGRARAIEADLLASGTVRRQGGLASASADVIVTNPPFLDTERSRVSPDARRAAAHGLGAGGLDRWVRSAVDLLKPKGRFALIHRADRLGEVLRACEGRFGAAQVRAVQPKRDSPAIRILLTAVKGSRAPMALVPPLILHGPDGRFTPEAAALHRGARIPGAGHG